MKQANKSASPTAKGAFKTSTLIEKGFFLFLYTIPVGYGISARSLDDYAKYALSIAGICFWLTTAWLCATRLRLGMERRSRLTPIARKAQLIFIGGNVAVSLVLGVVLYSAAVSTVDLSDWVLSLKPSENRQQFIGLAAAGILMLGGLFFWIRLKARFTYGLVEASMGVVVAVHRLSAEKQVGLPTDSGFYLAMLTAGIYLVVRGLDNMHQGWREAKDPLVSILLRLGTSPIYKESPRRLRPGSVSQKDRRYQKKSRIVEMLPKT